MALSAELRRALRAVRASAGSVDYTEITNLPAEFPPEAHTHSQSDVTGLTTDLAGKQEMLVSGTNIKTVNGASVIGSGDLVVSGGLTQPQILARTLGA